MSSSNTVPNPGRTTRRHTRFLCRGGSRDSYPILRVQVLSYQGVEASPEAKPFMTVSYLGKRFRTPVFVRDGELASASATFNFPISNVFKPGKLEFVVWDKKIIRNDYLCEYSLNINPLFRGAGFVFDEERTAELSQATTLRGSMRFKAGFVHPDSGGTYLIDLLPLLDGYIGTVVLLICGAKDLPKRSNATYMGWDVDPFVEVSIGNKVVGTTRVIQHSCDPVWYQQLDFPVRDSNQPIKLTVFDWDMFTSNDYIGEVKINISEISESPTKDPSNKYYPDKFPTMHEFEVNVKTKKPRSSQPTITFRASYQPYDTLWNHVYYMGPTRRESECPVLTAPTETIDPSSHMQRPQCAPTQAFGRTGQAIICSSHPPLSVSSPLRAIDSLADTQPLDNFHPTHQPTVESLRVLVSPPASATASAIQDTVNSGITTPRPTLETSISPPLLSTSTPAVIALPQHAEPPTPSDPPNLSPLASSGRVLDNMLPTGAPLSSLSDGPILHLTGPIIVAAPPSASPGPTSAPNLDAVLRTMGATARSQNDNDALGPFSTRAIHASTMPILDPPPQPPLVTHSDVVITGPSVREPDAERT
ncbi:hypothetical protein EDB83DRAFT_2531995 [Lactarius deliciosus]|nr:hypothetical protein EDB83DRAFT_2531995 [Lactarius deliciosus]